MPHPAEVHLLLRELEHRGDQRALGQASELGILHRLPEAAREGELLVRRELLVAKEDDQVIEQRLADLRDHGSVERRGHVDPADLGAQRPARRHHLDVTIRPGLVARHGSS